MEDTRHIPICFKKVVSTVQLEAILRQAGRETGFDLKFTDKTIPSFELPPLTREKMYDNTECRLVREIDLVEIGRFSYDKNATYTQRIDLVNTNGIPIDALQKYLEAVNRYFDNIA